VGIPKLAQPAKLIVSIIYHREELLGQALDALVVRWGSIDLVSERLAFDYTDYYEKEMGRDLRRRFISFQGLIDPVESADIKCAANDVEKRLSAEQWPNRSVNIDPGYLNESHVILSTTKPAPHRPVLQKGIYADLTLVFQNRTFQPFPWTYPDYRSEKMIAILCAIRQKYLFQRKYKTFDQDVVASRE
jgi:hypothetical protein